MLSKFIYDVGVLVVLVDVEALLFVDWGDAERFVEAQTVASYYRVGNMTRI